MGVRLPVVRGTQPDPADHSVLAVNAALLTDWLVAFLRDEVTVRRPFRTVVVGVSGGVDSAVTAHLCARALDPANVLGVRMPYRTSSPDSLEHAQLVIEGLGIRSVTVDISDAVDGLLRSEPDASPLRRGNVMARMRMIVLFDQAAKHHAIPVGTGNKTERMLGYYTWHGDDAPPVNPLGDLLKTQVRALARHLGVPEAVVAKPPSADLVRGQTDEADIGVAYENADMILHYLLQGYSAARLFEWGFCPADVHVVERRVNQTRWKRHLPATAMISSTAIGESHLRPTDYAPPAALPG
ncbi:MAG TPA: NAD+ synthase [Armatimonadota bacterium]|nr:NAD+ synthase [Armatimonadota bacterium]